MIYNMMLLSTTIGLAPGGRGKIHIYTQTVHKSCTVTGLDGLEGR
jgi:type 1 fimbria pilin